jgi:DNA-binding XRE family transcriptional regulator
VLTGFAAFVRELLAAQRESLPTFEYQDTPERRTKAEPADSDKSQEELAKLVGVSRNGIANIESGRKKIELSDLIMICRALNLGPVKVLNRVLRW